MPQIGYSHRPVALGTRGMVAAAHPLATLAGIETLKSGGTAADAAVAVNGVLAVTQPNSCGLGGDLFCLYYEAATGRVHFLNGGGRSGARASLRELARRGPDLFYTGRVGQAIAGRLEPEGFLTVEDLATHTGEWGEPIATTYRGVRVFQTPPPTQGLAALLALNLIEGFPLATLKVHSVEHLHLLLEMVKLAYADRDRWIGDPAHARLPVEALLSKAYAARRRAQFDPEKAQSFAFGDPEGDTTGFVVADPAGNVISVIQSLFNAFGSGVVVAGTGVVLQNRGRHFSLDPAHPAALAPRKRPFHTLIASIVTRDDEPLLALATMGGNGQAMFHAQVVTNVLDYGMDIQEAIERPRFLIGAFLPDEPADTTHIEARVPGRVVAALEGRGHRVETAPQVFTRVGHAPRVVRRDGTLMGGADPRGDGAALGF